MNILDRLKKDEYFISRYNAGMSELWRSGIFAYLRSKSIPQIIGGGADVNIMATQAAKSCGYHEALDDLIYFVEKYLTVEPSIADVPMGFGGIELALSRGDITQEEADDLRKQSGDTN